MFASRVLFESVGDLNGVRLTQIPSRARVARSG